MSLPHNTQNQPETIEHPPWYRQFWPWFLIAIPASAVVASMTLLWLAITNPVQLVVEDNEYNRLRSEMKAQPADRSADSSGKQSTVANPEPVETAEGKDPQSG